MTMVACTSYEHSCMNLLYYVTVFCHMNMLHYVTMFCSIPKFQHLPNLTFYAISLFCAT